MSRSFAFLLVLLSGCAAGADLGDPPSTTAEQDFATVCAGVRCLWVPQCAPGQHLIYTPQDCCGKCVGPDKTPSVDPGECVCYGGHLNAGYCADFGDPWTWSGQEGSCSWPAGVQGGLTAEDCAYVEAKHSGDGSGSDIYNLGLTCTYGQ